MIANGRSLGHGQIVHPINAVLQVKHLGADDDIHDPKGQRAKDEQGQQVGRGLQSLALVIAGQIIVAAVDPAAVPDDAVDAERQDLEDDVTQQASGVLSVFHAGKIGFLG